MSPAPRTPSPRRDATLIAAVEVARAAAVEVGGEGVGDHLGTQAVGERLVTHSFATTLPGYVGWHWAVTLVRVARAKSVTVDEVVLLPGDGALLAPQWVPWRERVRPGDLGPGDLAPPRPDDDRLVPAYLDSGDEQVDQLAFELGIGRERVLSRGGRLDAAQRWHDGEHGPDTAMARHAPATCGTCGFWLRLGGSLRAGFGVCANEITSTDGQITAADFGCGAHSEATVHAPARAATSEPVYDDGPEFAITP